MPGKLRAGILGYGQMGRSFVAAMQDSGLWDIAAVYDICGPARELARKNLPDARIYDRPDPIFADSSIDAVGLFTLADARPHQIRHALATHNHVLAEKPLAGGEIGDLAVIRVCHMTPGHMPLEGHDPEGPPFHDCGMHYVDVARWYANSEYKTWHAQGLRMWDYKDPWWVQAHGTFANGVAFDITQGFLSAPPARQQPHNCYAAAIGTKGVARMHHDFSEATVELYGVDHTLQKTAAFNDK